MVRLGDQQTLLSGFQDAEYEEAGATVLATIEEVYAKAEMIVKVKEPIAQEYPLIKVDISSASHPFYTGKQKLMDTSGRVDKFRKRYAQK